MEIGYLLLNHLVRGFSKEIPRSSYSIMGSQGKHWWTLHQRFLNQVVGHGSQCTPPLKSKLWWPLTNTSVLPFASPSDIEKNQRTMCHFYSDLLAFKKTKIREVLGEYSYVTSGDLRMYAKVRIQKGGWGENSCLGPLGYWYVDDHDLHNLWNQKLGETDNILWFLIWGYHQGDTWSNTTMNVSLQFTIKLHFYSPHY